MSSARSMAARNNPQIKRLMLATTAAVLCQFILSWLLSLLLDSSTTSFGGAWGSIHAIDCIVILIAMGLGGWIGGLRFLPIALLATAIIWLCSLLALAYTGLPVRNAPLSRNLLHGLRFNGMAIVASLLVAAVGSGLGATIGRHRPIRLGN